MLKLLETYLKYQYSLSKALQCVSQMSMLLEDLDDTQQLQPRVFCLVFIISMIELKIKYWSSGMIKRSDKNENIYHRLSFYDIHFHSISVF